MTNNDRQIGSGAATSDDIVRLYRDLLAREPESPFIIGERVGRPLLDVATDIALSEEFLGRVRASCAGATDEEVSRLYNLLLERRPESETAISEKAGRPIIEVVAEIALSEEFLGRVRASSAGATDAEVTRLYNLLLEREPESEIAISEKAGRPIIEVVAEIANSEEFSNLRVTQAQIAAETAELHQLLLPDAPIDAGTIEEIARIAHVHRLRLPTIARHMAAMDRAKRAAERGERFSGLGWTEPLSGDFRQSQTFGDQVELVIPTVNSERWLSSFLEFYKANRIRVVYAVDRRTSDGTRDLITKHGFPCIEVEAAEPRVEALLPAIAAQIAAPWILRLDDDELPTPNLLEFAANVAASDSIAAYSFPRANYRCNPASGRLERSYFFAFGPDAQLFRACRLYKPKSVAHHGELHTPGFFPSIEKFAAPDIYILHFDWVLRSHEARQRKFESYERQSPAVARRCKHQSLYETVPEAWHLFGEVQDATLQSFARNLRHIS
jgi:Glycosyl transferase family 2